MGGIDTDIDGTTSIAGLFSAGECACVSLNGANRLGSNSLTELLVFGARAGTAAARFAADHPQINAAALEAQAKDEQQRINRELISKTGGTQRIIDIRGQMHHAMEDGAGIFRDEKLLSLTRDKLAELQERYRDLILDDHTLSYNTELTSALELGFMLDVAETIAHSALKRTESRGSHQRLDHTGRDDENYLKHSLATFRNGEPPAISYKDVTITKWPPGARTYGADSGLTASAVPRS
jgi:fumarate reductase flavoprotein subunit